MTKKWKSSAYAGLAAGLLFFVFCAVLVGIAGQWLVSPPLAQAAEYAMNQDEYERYLNAGNDSRPPLVTVPDDISVDLFTTCLHEALTREQIEAGIKPYQDCRLLDSFEELESRASSITPKIEINGLAYYVLATHWQCANRGCGYVHIIAQGGCMAGTYYLPHFNHTVGSVQLWGSCRGNYRQYENFNGYTWNCDDYCGSSPPVDSGTFGE